MIEEHGDEWLEKYAYDEEAAAKAFTEEYNEYGGDYPLMDGDSIIVKVKNEKGEIKTFKCGAEQSIDYYINEVKYND
jgi:hypothetical protein